MVIIIIVILSAGKERNDIANKLEMAQKCLVDMEYEKAVEIYGDIIETDPKCEEAYIGLTEAYLGLNNESKAMETLERAVYKIGITAELENRFKEVEKNKKDNNSDKYNIRDKNKETEIQEDMTVDTATEPQGDLIIENVEIILSKDFDNYYPKTLRDVVLNFIGIQECYYNDNIESDKLEKLACQAMKLFDEKLVEVNPFDKYYAQLIKEIEQYKIEEKTIYSTILDKSSEIEYSEFDGVKYARINCIYCLKPSKGINKVTETYTLKCDYKGNWKILGWKIENN